jgi:hypothetical protein
VWLIRIDLRQALVNLKAIPECIICLREPQRVARVEAKCAADMTGAVGRA